MSVETPPNKDFQQHQAMRVLQMHQSPLPLSPSTPRKIFRESQSSIWIRSSRHKPVVQKVIEKDS